MNEELLHALGDEDSSKGSEHTSPGLYFLSRCAMKKARDEVLLIKSRAYRAFRNIVDKKRDPMFEQTHAMIVNDCLYLCELILKEKESGRSGEDGTGGAPGALDPRNESR
jgi:hypothetical protein